MPEMANANVPRISIMYKKVSSKVGVNK
jgi:hypothetical protein